MFSVRRFLGRKGADTGWRSLPRERLAMGPGCRVLGEPRIEVALGAHIECGGDVVLNSEANGYHVGMPFPATLLADRPGARISIGSRSRLHGAVVHAWNRIEIGRNCLLAAGAQLFDAHGHATELAYGRVRDRVQDRPIPIEIGDFCWIGLGALIMKGAQVGEGCVVAAYSVVGEGAYPPFSLIAGNPAQVVRSIAPEEAYPEDARDEDLATDGKTTHRY